MNPQNYIKKLSLNERTLARDVLPSLQPQVEDLSVWPADPRVDDLSVWPADPRVEVLSLWPADPPVEVLSIWPADPRVEVLSVWPADPRWKICLSGLLTLGRELCLAYLQYIPS